MSKNKTSMDSLESFDLGSVKKDASRDSAAKKKESGSPALEGTPQFKRAQRKNRWLPITGREITYSLIEIDPDDCVIHPNNQRIQALLSIESPKVKSLFDSMLREQQREPVEARWISREGKRVVEILEGSRRRFVGVEIKKVDPDFKLRAWVADIPDADAAHISKTANDDREDVSAWERSQYLVSVVESNPGTSYEVLSHQENMSQANFSYHLALAKIPIGIVQLLESPDLLSINSGLRIVKMIRDNSGIDFERALKDEAPYPSSNDMLKAMKAVSRTKEQSRPAVNKKITINQGETVRAQIGMNRKNEGQYKVDLFGISDNEYTKVLEALKEILGD